LRLFRQTESSELIRRPNPKLDISTSPTKAKSRNQLIPKTNTLGRGSRPESQTGKQISRQTDGYGV